MKHLRQACFAIAAILILYGIVRLSNLLLDLVKIYVSHYLWIAFQIIATILIIFIGLRVYSIAKTIKAARFTLIWRESRTPLLVLLLGCLALASVTCYPLSALDSIFPQPFRPFSLHDPISFSYELNYRWNVEKGGSIQMYTKRIYNSMPYEIVVDIISVSNNWVVVPYEIDGSNAIFQALGPATAEIRLGMIENGNHAFVVVMNNATDLFQIHKTDNMFWVEEVNALMGFVVQKNEFERRLDGFNVAFIGFPNIEEETIDFVFESIQQIGGAIIKNESDYGGWTAYIYFYYSGNLSNLRQIILEVAEGHPKYMVGIYSNTGWYELTWMYTFSVGSKPQYSDSIKEVILQKCLRIYGQGTWGNYIVFYVSSANLSKTDLEIKQDLVKSISETLGLKEINDFYVTN